MKRTWSSLRGGPNRRRPLFDRGTSKRSGARRRGIFESLEARIVLAAADADNLAVTEINYNPHDPLPGIETPTRDNDDFEFIELWNHHSSQTADLAGVVFTRGIDFAFDAGAVHSLAPGEYVVVVKNRAAFQERYVDATIRIAGEYSGSLSNDGERLELRDENDDDIFDFTYNDASDWPNRADGRGSSLEVKDILGNLDNSSNYRSSRDFHGSPGRAGTDETNDVIVNEVLAHTDLPLSDAIELFNTTSEPIDISNWYLSDYSGDDYFKYRIPAKILASGGYVTYNETNFNPNPLNPGPKHFALSSSEGDDVWLISADANGRPLRFEDHVQFVASLNGESFGRWPNATGDLYPMASRTFGSENSGPRVGPVIISEVMYNPPDPGPGVNPDNLEFVEIYNPTGLEMELNRTLGVNPADGSNIAKDWRLMEGVEFSGFPVGEILHPYSVILLLPFDPQAEENAELVQEFETHYGIEDLETYAYGPYAGQLANNGENLWLSWPDDPPLEKPAVVPRMIQDEVDFRDAAPWPESADGQGMSLTRAAIGLWGHDPLSWEGRPPTPGSVVLARNDQTETDEDTTKKIHALNNDGIDSHTAFNLRIVSLGATSSGGAATISDGGSTITYQPSRDFYGNETFLYQVSDGQGGFSEASVTVIVEAVNDPPVPADDAYVIDEDSLSTLFVLPNDSDADEDLLQILEVSPTSHGGTVVNFGTHLTYAPAQDFFGDETFNYTVSDGQLTAQAVVSVTVVNENDPPTALDDQFDVAEDSAQAVLAVLQNDSSDPDIDETLTVLNVSSPSNGGGVSIRADGAILYTPAANYNGPETFSYIISDGHQATSQARVTVNVQPENDDPRAVDDSFRVAEDSTTALNLLSNDSADPDVGETLRISEVTPGNQGGLVQIAGGGERVDYQPAADFFGEETFGYTISDGNGGTASAQVTVSVEATNDDPTAIDDLYTVSEDSSDNELNVVANDQIFPDVGEQLSLVSVDSLSAGGLAAISANRLSYTPAGDFHGEETLRYTISDGNGGTSQGTATITVVNTPDPPSAADDVFQTTEDAVQFALLVLSNDSSDPDPAQVLTIIAASSGSAGGLIEISGAELLYTPVADFFGVESFQYTIRDEDGLTDQGSVTVTVANSNDPPTAVDDAFELPEDSGDQTFDVLLNDRHAPDPEEVLSILSVHAPSQGGVASLQGDAIVYRPAANFFGMESLTYTITDNLGGTSQATVTVNVTAVNDAPAARDDSFSVDQDTTDNLLNPLENDSIAPDSNESLTITSVTATTAGGIVEIVAGVNLHYTPSPDYIGADSFRYTISDGNGGTDEATVTIGVLQTHPTSWQNPVNRLDVDGKGTVIPLDVLLIINNINQFGIRELPVPPLAPNYPPPFIDVDGNGSVEPRDALIVINFLNGLTASEGEDAARASAAALRQSAPGLEGRRVVPPAERRQSEARAQAVEDWALPAEPRVVADLDSILHELARDLGRGKSGLQDLGEEDELLGETEPTNRRL